VHSTCHVDDVHCFVDGVREKKEAGVGGAREGHPTRRTIHIEELELHGGRVTGLQTTKFGQDFGSEKIRPVSAKIWVQDYVKFLEAGGAPILT
jgi:hypothetical protein